MGSISANGNERSIRLVFDDNQNRHKRGCSCAKCERTPAAFLGYEIGGSLYSALATLPVWARPHAAELVLHERDRLLASTCIAEDINQAIALTRGHRGRPRQATCSRGHSLRSARIGLDGRRHCRRCEALVRTNARKVAGQRSRFEADFRKVG